MSSSSGREEPPPKRPSYTQADGMVATAIADRIQTQRDASATKAGTAEAAGKKLSELSMGKQREWVLTFTQLRCSAGPRGGGGRERGGSSCAELT